MQKRRGCFIKTAAHVAANPLTYSQSINPRTRQQANPIAKRPCAPIPVFRRACFCLSGYRCLIGKMKHKVSTHQFL